MDHYGDDQYDPDLTSGSDGSVLGTTIRNVAVLVGLCLALAWILSDLNGFTEPAASVSASASAGNRRAKVDEAPLDVAPAERPAQDAQSQQIVHGGAEILVPPGQRGHFIVVAAVNGVDVQFLVDTGASLVTLTEDDARRIGMPAHALDFSVTSQTANGIITVAPVTLRQIQLKDLELGDVDAVVTRAPLQISLLGMSFLSRLAGYEVRGDGLILRY